MTKKVHTKLLRHGVIIWYEYEVVGEITEPLRGVDRIVELCYILFNPQIEERKYLKQSVIRRLAEAEKSIGKSGPRRKAGGGASQGEEKMAKKDVTAIVSGAGWIASFADKLIKALREKGVSDEQIHKLVTEDGDVPVAKIAEAVAKATKAIGNTFRLVVDYDQPFDRMLYNLDCGYVNSNITEKNFPSKESGSKEVEFVLYHPNRVASSNEVLKGMEDLNLRPATLKELSAFGTRYPALQREFPIVALGSVWQFWRGGRRVPVLWDGGGERYLLLFWYDSDWDSRYRFLAVRKS